MIVRNGKLTAIEQQAFSRHLVSAFTGKQNKKIKHKVGMYKDLVELASALDWIDSEDEA